MDYTIDGKCPEGCVKCCTCQLPVSLPEIKKLKQYIRRNEIEDSNLGSESCPFLNQEGRCRVYIHRPSVCKFFNCSGSAKIFEHRDKSIIDMRETFYPGTSTLTNTEQLNRMYQIKKAEVYGNSNL